VPLRSASRETFHQQPRPSPPSLRPARLLLVALLLLVLVVSSLALLALGSRDGVLVILVVILVVVLGERGVVDLLAACKRWERGGGVVSWAGGRGAGVIGSRVEGGALRGA